MKLILSVLTLSLCLSLSAATSNLEDQKTITNNELDGAISRLEENRPCIKAAKSVEELRKCRDELRNDMLAIRESYGETKRDIRDYHRDIEKKK